MIDERANSLEIKENCNESQTSKKLNRKRFRKSEDNIYNIMNVSTAKKKKKFAKSLSYPKKHRRKALNHTDKEINAKENENPIEIYQTDSSDEDEEEFRLIKLLNKISFNDKIINNDMNELSYLKQKSKRSSKEEHPKDNNRTLTIQSILFSSSLYNIKPYKFIGRKKIDLVLDLDQTLLYTTPIKDISDNRTCNDVYKLSLKVSDEHTIYYQVTFRPKLKEFIAKVSKFCNLYINTQAQKQYAYEVINIMRKDYELSIEDRNIITSTSMNYKPKTISSNITNENFLIVDDTITSWNELYYDNIIPSMTFYSGTNRNCISHYYFNNGSIFEFDESKRCSKDSIAYSAESTISKNKQLMYIYEAIHKSYLLSLIRKIPIKFAFRFIRENVLKDCILYLYIEDDIEFYKEMIFSMGGAVTIESSKASHVVYGKETQMINDSNKYNVNIKWLYHCYFFVSRMDEKDDEYKYIERL